MPYSVEGTLEFCLADVSRLLRFAVWSLLFLLLVVLTILHFIPLTRGWSRLAGTQGAEQLEAQSRQSQLFDQIWNRGFLQVADHLSSYEQSCQLLKWKGADNGDHASSPIYVCEILNYYEISREREFSPPWVSLDLEDRKRCKTAIGRSSQTETKIWKDCCRLLGGYTDMINIYRMYKMHTKTQLRKSMT